MLAHDEVDDIFNQQVEEALQESDTRAEDYEAHELALKVRYISMMCIDRIAVYCVSDFVLRCGIYRERRVRSRPWCDY